MTPPPRLPLLAFASGKGGTGKSTGAAAVAQLLADTHGLRVALVDLDPQAGATDYVGAEPVTDPLTAEPIDAFGVALYRGGRALATMTAAQIGAHLERVARTAPGVVVVDLAPALHDAAHRAVLARPEARLVLAVRLDGGGIRAAQELVGMADAAGRPYVVAPMFGQARRALSAAVLKSLRAFYGERVLADVVPDDARAAEAATVGRPVPLHAPRSKAAEAFRGQTSELVARFGLASAPTTAPVAKRPKAGAR